MPSVHITTALTYLIAFSGEQNTIYPRAEPIVANKKFFLPDTAINATANGQQPPTTLEKQRRKATSPHSTRLPYITIFFKSFLGILILSLTALLIPSVNVKFFPEIVSLINESSFVFVFVYVVCRKNTNG